MVAKKDHSSCDCEACRQSAKYNEAQLKQIFDRGSFFITSLYRIRPKRYIETPLSITWRMFNPSFNKLDLILVYSKANDSFEIMETSGNLY